VNLPLPSQQSGVVNADGVGFSKPLRVALVTNVIAAYRLPELRKLSACVGALAIFVSRQEVEDNLAKAQADGLDVHLMQSLSWRQASRHPAGYDAESRVFIPLTVLSQLRTFSPDVVISAELGARTLLCGLYRLIASDCRLIVHADLSERSEAGRGRLRTLLRRWLLRMADAVIVNGRSGARYLARLGVDPAKIFAVPYSSNAALFGTRQRSRSSPGRRRLIYVGRLLPAKGLLSFCKALSDWCRSRPDAQVEFVVVGEGELRGPLAREAIPVNLKLVMTGAIPYEVLPDLYSRADVFVFPTLGDTWGLVVNEAMVSGLPVLGSEHSQAVQELVEDGWSGWRFFPEQEAGMRAAVERALSTSEEALESMGANARIRALALTPDTVAASMLKVIEFAARAPTEA
jgi:glycosyltransferase involved in cell wall biosynthesis